MNLAILRRCVVWLGPLIAGCSTPLAAPQPTLPQINACFVTDDGQVPVVLELAREPEQRKVGLMERTQLAERHGMLFEYQAPRRADQGFWMYRTRIPLDVAYLSEDGVIGTIRQMTPCSSSIPANCPTWPAGVPHWHVVEMNAGFFDRHGITTGDRLALSAADCREG